MLIIILTSFFGLYLQAATFISTSVGQVKDHVVTSREVQIYYVAEKILYGGGKQNLTLPEVETPAFGKEITGALMEWVVFLEAEALSTAQVTPAELTSAFDKVRDAMRTKKELSRLQASDREIKAAVERKHKAKKFIQLKAETSVIPVTDAEVEKYFNDNKARFGNLPLAQFKDNIRAFLTRQQVDKRLKDWFEVLQAKYQVRHFLAEL